MLASNTTTLVPSGIADRVSHTDPESISTIVHPNLSRANGVDHIEYDRVVPVHGVTW